MQATNDIDAKPASSQQAVGETPDLPPPIESQCPQKALESSPEPPPEADDREPLLKSLPGEPSSNEQPSSEQPSSEQPSEPPITRLLEFLSTATPGTLAAAALGLSLATYVLLGRLGLVLIGALGGIVLFISYESRHPEVSRALRREGGQDVIQRLLQELQEARQKESASTSDETEEQSLRSFDDFCPETRDALKSLTDAIIKDYIKWWYGPIVPSDRSFPLGCRKLLSSFLVSTSNHVARKRPADVFLDFLTNSTSMVVVFFAELSAAFAELPPDSDITPVDAVYNYLASNSDSNLAHLLNQQQQANKFKVVAEDLLGFINRNAYDCEVVRVFLREIIAGVILDSTLRSCSKPEWINGWIVYLLEAGEPDFSQAIDVGMQTDRDANPVVFTDLDGNATAALIASSNQIEQDAASKKANDEKEPGSVGGEMDEVLEQMKRMNQMIAEEDARKSSITLDRADLPVSPSTSNPAESANNQAGLGVQPAPSRASSRTGLSLEETVPEYESVDHQSGTSETVYTPITPLSTSQTPNEGASPKETTKYQFTNFDQIVPPAEDTTEDGPESQKAPLTVHNATITVHDDTANDKNRIRSKPIWDYLIQIEPSSSHYPGWMIVRRYSDFETLHEVLRRIANISGATTFTEQHSALPPWGIHTRDSLRGELERYLRDACCYRSLAECEGLKRFLDKDGGVPQNEPRHSFGLDNLGKNVLDALTIAPKNAMQGGRAVVGGVTGVLGNIGLGQRKQPPPAAKEAPPANGINRLSISTPPRVNSLPSPALSQRGRDSIDSQRSSVISTQPGRIAPMERRPSSQYDMEGSGDDGRRAVDSARSSRNGSRASSRAPSRAPPARSPSSMSLNDVKLPPLPDDMPDDYPSRPGLHKRSMTSHGLLSPKATADTTIRPLLPITPTVTQPPKPAQTSTSAPNKPLRQHSPLSEQEASVAVELMFAIINELYTLSSAWNIRRTLLGAAKSFLLRPGNPSLASIRSVIQESVLEPNVSDAGIAAHLRKLRENVLPTEEERATWPAEMTQAEKDKLRDKARSLLIRRGVPAALTGVMGQSATSDAVGRVFDCLQIEEVARGLMFGIILQAMRIITH